MFRFLCLFVFMGVVSLSQTTLQKPAWFKGDHFVIYNKCKTAVLFCESTQQDYTFCGAVKNCQGLFVMPGDTFLLNYEDKLQTKTIVADISFQNYLPTISGYTFMPVDSCIPPQPLQVIIPLSAVNGSSFQITAQSPDYYPTESFQPSIPLPIYVYVGGQQPTSTTALSEFTNCPIHQAIDTTATAVSVNEFSINNSFDVHPNPTNNLLNIKVASMVNKKGLNIEIMNCFGQVIFHNPFKDQINISDLPNGIYFIHLGNYKPIKIVKQ